MSTSILLSAALLLLAPGAHAQSLEAVFNQGAALEQAGDVRGAAARWEDGLAQSRAVGNKNAAASFAARLSVAYFTLKDYDRSIAYGRENLELARALGKRENEAMALQDLGLALLTKGDSRGALDAYGQAASAYRALGDAAREAACRAEVAGAQLALGDNAAAAATLAALTPLDASVGDLFAQARTFTNLGLALDNLGRYDEAIRYDERALEAYRRLGDKESEALVVGNIGGLYSSRSDFAKARQYSEEALRLAQAGGYRDTEANARLNLGNAAEGVGDFARALEQHGAALAVFRSLGDAAGESAALGNMGNSHRALGDFAKALDFHRRALDGARAQRDAEGEANALNNIGVTEMAWGRLPAAAEHFTQAIAVYRAQGLRVKEAVALNNLGIVHSNLGDGERALEFKEAALALARQLGNKEQEGAYLSNIGVEYSNRGERQKALGYYEAALAAKKAAGAPTVVEERNIAGEQLGLGRLDAAEAGFARTKDRAGLGMVRLKRKQYAEAKRAFSEHLASAAAGRASELLPGNIGLGLALEGLKDDAGAAAAFKRALELVERMRSGLDESQRLNFFTAVDEGYARTEPAEGLMRVSLRLPGGAAESFRYAEWTKSRLFAESVARKYGRPETRIPDALAQREAGLAERAAALRKRADAALEKGDTALVARLEDESAALAEESDRFVDELRRAHPEYAAALYPQPVRAERVPLAPGEVLLEYDVTEPLTRFFLVKEGAVFAGDIPVSREELEGLVGRYRAFFEGVQGEAQLAAFDPRLGRRLYELLLKPALAAKDAQGRPWVAPGAKLVVVPDEALVTLPFESLVARLPETVHMPRGRHGPAPVGVVYAGDELDIAYSQSANALTLARSLKRPAPPAKALFALADPVFGPSDSRYDAGPARSDGELRVLDAVARLMGAGGARAGRRGEKAVAGASAGELPRLDKTGALALSLRDEVFKGEAADVLLGRDATEPALAAAGLGAYRNLVFATHGLLDGSVPYLREPALALSRAEPPSDGFLTMSEVMSLRLNADVVALTACQTGLGRSVGGEGVTGLGRAFQYAGARSVVASLWSVSEDSTTELAKRFFVHVKAGKGRREALRLARAEVRREGYEHPFYWAPFVLVGD